MAMPFMFNGGRLSLAIINGNSVILVIWVTSRAFQWYMPIHAYITSGATCQNQELLYPSDTKNSQGSYHFLPRGRLSVSDCRSLFFPGHPFQCVKEILVRPFASAKFSGPTFGRKFWYPTNRCPPDSSLKHFILRGSVHVFSMSIMLHPVPSTQWENVA